MPRFNSFLASVLILQFVATLPAAPPDDGSQPTERSTQQRPAWTSSRVHGSPEPPPPYIVEPAFPHLTFNRPVVVTNAPGSPRLFIAEQGGKIHSFVNQPGTTQLDLVADLKQHHTELSTVYGLTFHPDFAKNRLVYICYVVDRSSQGDDGTRVASFKMQPGEPPQLDLTSEQIIITWKAGGHNGGCLKFGPDGFLYISTGDAAGPSPPDTLRSGQDITNVLSALLRIDINVAEPGKAYTVPADNPFVDMPGARPEVWAYGFRNPWKMSFDKVRGDLWVGDVGWEQWEMIYRVDKGGNYGWSIMEGRQQVLPNDKRGPTPILPPIVDHPHSEAASITGGFVYYGTRLPELQGAYIYGDYQSGKVWGLRHDGNKVTWHAELANTPLALVGFGVDNTDELYLLDYSRTQQLYRLAPNPVKERSQDFPQRLSQTGLFASTAEEIPAAGIIAYDINARHWADGTEAKRWLAVPDTGQIEIDKNGNWIFPNGSVLVKTVAIETKPGQPDSRQRLETQILHFEDESWRPYTYIWNNEQTDAVLADKQGSSRTLTIQDADFPTGQREQTYQFAARTECKMCHNPWVEKKTTIFGVQSASPLALNTLQLNRDGIAEFSGKNQITALADIGLLAKPIQPAPSAHGRFTDPYDDSAELEARVRSYLHVNCAHCHQFNAGGTAVILLSHDIELAKTRLLNERPTQGTFGISDARIVAPGDPFGSILYYRLAKLGGGRMPRVGSRMVDESAVAMLHDWISQLPTSEGAARTDRRHDETIHQALAVLADNTVAPASRAPAINELTSTVRGALALSQALHAGRLSNQARNEVIAATRDHPQVEIRDLFEKYIPEAERVQRLGAIVNQAEILRLEADAARGKAVFFSESAGSCKNCHRIGDQGKPLGPDLTAIGKKYRREQLLQHILEPSKFMEPKYVPYLLETKNGRVHSGLLTAKTDTSVILTDAQNKQIQVTPAEVELLVPQQKSLMPELLLRDMTQQQVADLLAFLATLGGGETGGQ